VVATPSGGMEGDSTLGTCAATLSVGSEINPRSCETRSEGHSLADGESLGDDMWYTAPLKIGLPCAVKMGREKHYTNTAKALSVVSRPWLVMLIDGDGKYGGRVNKIGDAGISQQIIDLAG
jgi:hypothetical protein